MNTKFNERRARALTFMLSLGMLAGVLIWAKLRLVTDIPRSALADPKQVDPGMSPDSDVIHPANSSHDSDELDTDSGDSESGDDQVID